ncbi:hypothetical protein COCC4DRAFT_31122, partial [Bipolaris maydis ATCC 48331]
QPGTVAVIMNDPFACAWNSWAPLDNVLQVHMMISEKKRSATPDSRSLLGGYFVSL